LVDCAADDGLSHLALTDTNVLYGAVAFDRACRDAGIQPIIGTMNVDRMRACCRAVGVELDRGDWYRLYLAARGQRLP
jgi:predicted oxidoreductase